MRLNKAISLFLGEHKASTRKSYYYVLEAMKNFIGPAREVHEIEPHLLIEYNSRLQSRTDYAPATVHKHLKAIKAFFNWCVNVDLIAKSPARAIRVKRLKRRISKDKAMTDAELDAVLDCAKWKPRDYALILFLADTGCRAGGAAGLKIEDVDFANLEAVVLEKGDVERKVGFGELCRQAMITWLLKRPARSGPYVFSHDGKPIKPDNVSLVVRRNCKKAGVRSLGSHSLRHRKGHQLATARVAPSIAATVLGHTDVKITLDFYYPSDWDTAKKAVQELSKDSEDRPRIIKLPITNSR